MAVCGRSKLGKLLNLMPLTQARKAKSFLRPTANLNKETFCLTAVISFSSPLQLRHQSIQASLEPLSSWHRFGTVLSVCTSESGVIDLLT